MMHPHPCDHPPFRHAPLIHTFYFPLSLDPLLIIPCLAPPRWTPLVSRPWRPSLVSPVCVEVREGVGSKGQGKAAGKRVKHCVVFLSFLRLFLFLRPFRSSTNTIAQRDKSQVCMCVLCVFVCVCGVCFVGELGFAPLTLALAQAQAISTPLLTEIVQSVHRSTLIVHYTDVLLMVRAGWVGAEYCDGNTELTALKNKKRLQGQVMPAVWLGWTGHRHGARLARANPVCPPPPQCQTAVCSTDPRPGTSAGCLDSTSNRNCSISPSQHVHRAKCRHAYVCPVSPRAGRASLWRTRRHFPPSLLDAASKMRGGGPQNWAASPQQWPGKGRQRGHSRRVAIAQPLDQEAAGVMNADCATGQGR